MRAAFQILAIPYQIIDGAPRYCVFHRADHDQWQFIAGGGEDEETPLEAAKRETFEEGGNQRNERRGLYAVSSLSLLYLRKAGTAWYDESSAFCGRITNLICHKMI